MNNVYTLTGSRFEDKKVCHFRKAVESTLDDGNMELRVKSKPVFLHLGAAVFLLILCIGACGTRKDEGWVNYKIKQGVEAIAVDPSGKVWIANDLTIRSIGNYDVQSFGVSPPDTGMYTFISSLVFDPLGNIWISLDHNFVYRHDGEGNWKQYKIDNFLNHLQVDGRGYVWVNGILDQYLIDPESDSITKVNNKFGSGWVIGPVTVDQQGQVWSVWYPSYKPDMRHSTPSQLKIITKDDTLNLVTQFDASTSIKGSALAVSEQGQVWLRIEQGVRLIYPEGSTRDYLFDQPYHVIYQTMVIDNHGHVWTGTEQGLFMLDPDVGWKRYTKSNSGLIGNKIHCLLVDQEGHLWVGTDKGVSVLAIDSVPSTQGEWIPAH